MRLSPATVDQYAAHAALSVPESWFQDVNARYRSRRDTLVSGLRDIGLTVPTPEGAFYLALPLPVEDAESFCAWLVSEFSHQGQTVCLAPLAGFYRTKGLGQSEVRMTYCIEEDSLRTCVEILDAGLKAWASR